MQANLCTRLDSTTLTNNSNNVDFVTGFQILDLKDINLKLDDFCLKVIQRAKTLSHYLNVFKDGNSTTSNEIFGKATANSPTALLNVNETYASLKRRAKNSFHSQLIDYLN
ncbi:unnamed protein product [Ambrosiozyma monospora]|uniref:Unnamed protein product n=1 Tax=Ambrosiozyma monospora TaxID=43982 RepID=A0ACB5SWH3_AMBMO|nr:unnamed protein product [Ambrosiozyma monospora]